MTVFVFWLKDESFHTLHGWYYKCFQIRELTSFIHFMIGSVNAFNFFERKLNRYIYYTVGFVSVFDFLWKGKSFYTLHSQLCKFFQLRELNSFIHFTVSFASIFSSKLNSVIHFTIGLVALQLWSWTNLYTSWSIPWVFWLACELDLMLYYTL